nr:MarR family transcriptional regulator [Sedimentibacter sp.]
MNKEEQVIMAINNLYNKIGWLNRLKLEESTQNNDFQLYTSSEIFCIEYIGNNVDLNGTRLARACFMTRSALSKLTKKLIKKGLIERYQKPDNKKEIYFRLTEKGKDIYNIHEEMTSKFLERDKVVFEKISKEQLDNMLFFFDSYNSHLDRELKQMDVDNK